MRQKNRDLRTLTPLGRRLERLRRARNMTSTQLADAMGVHRASVRNISLGLRPVRPEQIDRLAKRLGMSEEERLSWHIAAARQCGWRVPEPTEGRP